MNNKSLPRNIEAEQAVLGSILIEGSAIIDTVQNIISQDDLYRDSHKKILNAMIELDRLGKAIDILTLFDYLKSNGQLLEEV